MVNVLIADDSPTTRLMLADAINATAGMRVVGEAVSGKQAVKLTTDLRPDVILMDLIMPDMDGLAATREIMHDHPTPIVIVSATLDSQETNVAFQAIQAGALTALQKPAGPRSPDHGTQMRMLISTLRTMSSVHVIHHWKRPGPVQTPPAIVDPEPVHLQTKPDLIAIASSTGGPAALSTIIQGLPADFPVPIVIAQHITPDFVPSLAGWLSSVTGLTVSLARPGERPQPGHIYLAPGDHHLSMGYGERFVLDKRSARYTPSADVLLESVAARYGNRAIGIVLTGMGDDGAKGLRAMYERGAFTIAQDEASSVVYGMPQQAVAIGAVRKVLPLTGIPQALVNLTGAGDPIL